MYISLYNRCYVNPEVSLYSQWKKKTIKKNKPSKKKTKKKQQKTQQQQNKSIHSCKLQWVLKPDIVIKNTFYSWSAMSWHKNNALSQGKTQEVVIIVKVSHLHLTRFYKRLKTKKICRAVMAHNTDSINTRWQYINVKSSKFMSD